MSTIQYSQLVDKYIQTTQTLHISVNSTQPIVINYKNGSNLLNAQGMSMVAHVAISSTPVSVIHVSLSTVHSG